MKTYIVTVIPKRPAWDDEGAGLEVIAKDRADALKQARKMVDRHSLYDRTDGPLLYRAKLALITSD